MDCCNYPEYRAAPYYYYPGQYPPYWGGGTGYGGGYGPQYAPPPAPSPVYPGQHHVQPPRDLDYGHAQTHHMPTDYVYGGKDRLRRMRERAGETHRGALEWAEGSYLPPGNDGVRDTPWSYYQNGCNGWQSGGGRSGYPVRPVALPGGFPPPPPLVYPHRDPLRGLAAMQATSITPDKISSCSWDQYHRETDERMTPRTRPPSVSPAPRMQRQSKAKEETKAATMERSRKNKSPKNVAREEIPPEPVVPPKPTPDAVPLPAFQQAFGSTEIGRFSEAFTSAGAITEDMVSKAISQGLQGEWRDANWGDRETGWPEAEEAPWPARNKQIKCEDTY